MDPLAGRPLKALTRRQAEQFVTDGYVVIPEVFPRETAERLLPLVWERLPEDREDRSTWQRAGTVLEEIIEGPAVEEMFTRRYVDALDDLLGEGRWRGPLSGLGFLPIRFAGFAEPPWTPPDKGWHLDGNHFHHRLCSPEQAAVGIELLTDIDPGGGGTAVKPGSHRFAARVLADAEPDGLAVRELGPPIQQATAHLEGVELTGRAGDVIVMHPHLVHAASANTSDRVRIIGNRGLTLREPMRIDRENPAEHSLVELAIRFALDEREPAAV